MSTTASGRDAETRVAEMLKKEGYRLIAQNWRTRWCEIDLIMTKTNVVYFIEVKYRSRTDFGRGLEYITSKKQQQMRFAAELWMSSENWKGDALLAAVEVGPETTAIELIVVE